MHETEAKAKAATLKETQATLSKEIDAAVRELSTFRFSHEQVRRGARVPTDCFQS